MKVKSVLIGLIFSLFLPCAGFGATAKCKVVSVNGDQVQLECTQIVGKIRNGQWVKMKTQNES